MTKKEEIAGLILPLKTKLKVVYTELAALAEIAQMKASEERGDEAESLSWQEQHIHYACREIENAVFDLDIALKEAL